LIAIDDSEHSAQALRYVDTLLRDASGYTLWAVE
jgi:hypothetical protein